MKKYFILGLLMFPATAMADFNVLYDTSNLAVIEYGYQKLTQYSTWTAYGIGWCKEINVSTQPLQFLKYDNATKSLIPRAPAVILLIQQNQRKREIRDRIEVLVNNIQTKNFLASEGFNVVVDTTAMRTEINTLKTEYATIP